MSDRVPDLFVEKLVLGELDPAKAASVEARLAEEPGGMERVAAIQSSNAEVLAAMPPRVFAAAVEQRAAAVKPRTSWGWATMAVPAFAALAAVLIAVPLFADTSGEGIEDGVRAKGSPALQLHRLGDEAPLPDGTAIRAGETVQISYTASGAEFGAILSVDGNGVVSWHLPADGRQAVRLRAGGGVPLDHSYELDDAPDFEQFIFVTGPDRFELASVESQVQEWFGSDHGDVQLAPPLRTTLFSVDKEAP